MLSNLFRRRRKPPVVDRESLCRFLDQRAALITQKTIIGYCHVKTNLPISELIVEKQFADAFDRSRWEAYAAILADLVVIAEGRLRVAAGAGAAVLPARLAELYGAVLASRPCPVHRAGGWHDEVAALRGRLAEAQESPPRPVAEVSRVSARKVFRSLPIHERLRRPDAPAVEAGVRFLFVGLAREFDRDLDHAALADALLAAETDAVLPHAPAGSA